MYTYGRPTKKEQILLAKRKAIIINLWSTKEYTQAELAFIFRVPRNTIHQIVK
jgi:predicted DNA-binding protein YlxM (UPF0122 family)